MQAMPVPDEELLDRFVRRSDPRAFHALVTRHGPMVLRVCRSVLRDPHETEDAFQATFLVLVQRASTIRDPDSLGRWLCGVAYKTAARVRRRAIRRRQYERPWADDPAGEPPGPECEHDVFLLVREELDRLPEKYRAPLVLCYLEGLTHEQAATELGWASGTVKVRLVRGRRLLRERLDRRKIALGAGFLLLWRREAAAAPAEGLAQATVRAMARAAAKKSAGGTRFLPDWFRSPWTDGPAYESLAPIACGLVILLGIAWGLLEGPALASGQPAALLDVADLPANLTDVLAVDCR